MVSTIPKPVIRETWASEELKRTLIFPGRCPVEDFECKVVNASLVLRDPGKERTAADICQLAEAS